MAWLKDTTKRNVLEMIIPISSKKLQKYETYEATSALALNLDGHPIRQMYRIFHFFESTFKYGFHTSQVVRFRSLVVPDHRIEFGIFWWQNYNKPMCGEFMEVAPSGTDGFCARTCMGPLFLLISFCIRSIYLQIFFFLLLWFEYKFDVVVNAWTRSDFLSVRIGPDERTVHRNIWSIGERLISHISSYPYEVEVPINCKRHLVWLTPQSNHLKAQFLKFITQNLL